MTSSVDVLPLVGTVLILSMGASTGMTNPMKERGAQALDLYALPQHDLQQVAGIVVTMACDQVFLQRQADVLERFIAGGGRVAAMGHPIARYLPNQGEFRRLDYTGDEELRMHPGEPHPVWEGVDFTDVSSRRGVSGFYCRGFTLSHPPGAVVTSRIGPNRLPVDYVYPYGDGQVLIHPGIDLGVFAHDDNAAARMQPQLLHWLASRA